MINAEGELIDARLKQGLLPTPLTRDLKWGIPVPVDEDDSLGMKGKVLCKLLHALFEYALRESFPLNRCLGRFSILHLMVRY